MSAWAQSLTPSIAADPVSPEVAPTMVTRRSCCDSTWSNSRADQLQGDVLERQGRPVEQLLTKWSSPICTSGTTAGWANVAYASAHIAAQRVGRDLVADEQSA